LGVAGTTIGLIWADAARRDAETAQWQTEVKRQEADDARVQAGTTLYLNRISLADRECAAFNLVHAEELLALCPPDRRRWEWQYLSRLCHGELRSVDALHTVVNCLARSPDGKLLAGAVSDALDARQRRELVVWDADTGAVRTRMAGHSAPVSGLAFSPDGQRLAAASWDINRGATGEVKLWDVATGTEILTLPGHVSGAFRPEGRFLASVGGDVLGAGIIKVWDGGNQ
jgi:WD40 repeat protein